MYVTLAQAAMAGKNGMDLDGRWISVEFATEKKTQGSIPSPFFTFLLLLGILFDVYFRSSR